MSNTVQVTISKVTRETNSVDGNPTKVLWTDKGNYRTKPNAAVAYNISDDWQDVRATLELSPAGTVTGLTLTEQHLG